jgi:hypothetical protein
MIDEAVCRSPLTDAEIGALADGAIEAISPAAMEHAETCSSCAARIADEAMLALQVGDALMALAAEPAPAEPARAPTQVSTRPAVPSPTIPIMIALAVAAVASLPLVPSLGRSSVRLIASGDVYRNAAWQGVTALVGSLNGPVVTFTVASGLVALAALVARFSHRLTVEPKEL